MTRPAMLALHLLVVLLAAANVAFDTLTPWGKVAIVGFAALVVIGGQLIERASAARIEATRAAAAVRIAESRARAAADTRAAAALHERHERQETIL